MACAAVDDAVVRPHAPETMPIVDTAAAASGDFSKAELPKTLSGPLVWSGVDFQNEEAYAFQLGQSDVEEIDAALQSFKALGVDGEDGDQVTQDNFRLPNLESRLADCAATIHGGRGFFVLKGLDGSKYSVEDSVTIYLGIASYIADKRGLQDRKGNVLSHITSSKLWTVPVEQRHGIHSSKALPYHNDMGCDVLALQVRHGAKSGGYTYLSSVWTAFNELLAQEPAVAQTLLTPDWPVQISGRKAQYYIAPALAIHKGKLMASLDPNRFGPHPSSGATDIPSLTAAQTSALEKLSEAAYRTEVRLKLMTGDFLFFNNWALLHRRDSYTDDEDASRHMVRLWLRNTQLGWPVPASLSPPWLAAYGDGLVQKRLYPLIPMTTYKVPKYSAGSAAFVLEDSDASDNE